ncbi:MAG: phage terminase large subunit [Gemmatimonadota bacterium]|nr:phage terminase large subunit [Gemmatimonadota bacterium]
MLATDLALALDPVRIAHLAGLNPDPWQADLLRSRARQMILLCSRQAGKSTVSALLAVDDALHRAPALILLLAPALRQAQELFRKVKEVLHALGPAAPPIAQESALTLELANGSRIVALPGKESTIRGYSAVNLLVVDEASRVPDELNDAVRPMLSVSGGRIILLSTPWGKRGFFFDTWSEGAPDWQRVRITAHDVPRISPAWLEAERQRIPDFVFRQEYLTEFGETEDQVFSYTSIMTAITSNVRPLFGAAA